MKIFLALPTYDGTGSFDLAMAVLREAPKHEMRIQTVHSSLLTNTFNTLWCEALNGGYDYFLMVHSDVVPTSPDWIQALLDERALYGADALCAVLPIKDEKGLTSIALTQDGNSNQRRLTIRECRTRLPETFDAHDCAHALDLPHDSMLLLNTGLLLVDLQTHRAAIEQLVFHMRDVVERGSDGVFRTWTWSEDWHWSRDAHALGLRLMATRKVAALHRGKADYCNCCEWGTLEQDDTGAVIPEREIEHG